MVSRRLRFASTLFAGLLVVSACQTRPGWVRRRIRRRERLPGRRGPGRYQRPDPRGRGRQVQRRDGPDRAPRRRRLEPGALRGPASTSATTSRTRHVAYIENVAEGADSEQVFRSLARKGFNFIIGTSFGYMDPMEAVAKEFPDITFLHLTGYKSNGKNFGNFFGAMEDFKYLAGMLAGSRAKKDGNPKIGYMATFPIPEELRLGNAIMLGVKRTCPECTMDIRFINTWHDPIKEKDGAASLFDAGAQVVFTGADTGAVADVAQEKGKWAVTYDHQASCKVDACLTAPYWIWGPEYARIAE